MVGVKGERVEAWGTVDEEYLRRFAQAVPDWDPRYWDEEFAKTTRFKGRIVPPLMISYMAYRRPLSEKDVMDEVMNQDPFSDGGLAMGTQKGALPPVPTHLKRHLHGGDAVEVYQYPRIGDRISYQYEYTGFEERIGGDGKPMLIIHFEARYWNQKNELLCVVKTTGVQR